MTLSQGRDIALVILIAEAFVLGLILVAAFYLAVRGMQRLLPQVRRWLQVAYEWVFRVGVVVDRLMRWLLAPVLLVASLVAGLQGGVAALKKEEQKR
jgi:hypothetical protein